MENSKENMHFYIRAERVKGRTCEYIDAPLPGPMSIFFESVFFFLFGGKAYWKHCVFRSFGYVR